MKLSEVIARLEENPEPKFECIYRGRRHVFYTKRGFFFLDIYSKDGKLIPRLEGAGGFYGNLAVDMYWRQVIEPVDFMEAVNNGRRIRPAEHSNEWGDGWEFRSFKQWMNAMGKGIMFDNCLDYINGLWEVEP